MISFRITTYNIHKCRGLDRRVRPQRIIDVLKETKSDVIALQEVVGMDDPERERNQVRSIAEALGFDFRMGENRRLHGGAYGNALLTRLPIISEHNHDITWRKSEPRGCLEVTLTLDSQNTAAHLLRIFNVHLGTGFFERRYQARKLLDVLANHAEQSRRLVLGDFNEWPRGLASHLLQHHFNTAEPQTRLGRAWSYPGILPLAHVDHIYYDSSLKLIKVAIHRSRLALIASDHLPLVGDFSVL
ncbi:MAG TPA: endonuclease/exonuclease/phosphatase family protein [Pyrinomonadaceae bacterium]|nr:endonuclease/exonuclease/phosphatase family protein [Pyrinomonadaceae bacterium]